MGLVQRLDTLDASKCRISEERFARLKKAGETFGEQKMISMNSLINRLRDTINQKLLPTIEDNDIDSQLDLEGNHD